MGQLHISLDPARIGRDSTSLQRALRAIIIGQDEAINDIVDVYQMYVTGMSAPGRPIANFLFLGPTGSGKTRTVEALAEALVNNPSAVVKIDCAEYQHGHEIAKLIGSPPGYLGHRETHALLSQETLDESHSNTMKVSFVLFDEIEKASDVLWNLLLGILDKGIVTLGDNKRVDFSRSMIFMTSNLGAAEMETVMTPKLGFKTLQECTVPGYPDEKLDRKLFNTGEQAARRKFTPEFMNRIDKVVVFKPLEARELRRVLDIELANVQRCVLNSSMGTSFVFTVTDSGKAFLLSEGTDLRYGARHLKRAIDRLLVRPLSHLIASEQVSSGDWVQVDFDENAQKLVFTKEAEDLGISAMARVVQTKVGLLPLLLQATA